jgi:Ca2+-binding EF-hand superfamily protein
MDTKELKDNKDNKPQFNRKDYLDIKEIMEEYGLSDMRIRTCIRNKTLKSILVFVGQTKTQQHLVHINDVIEWRENSSKRSKRSDNRNKYVIYCDDSEKEQISLLIKENKMTIPTIERANMKKTI